MGQTILTKLLNGIWRFQRLQTCVSLYKSTFLAYDDFYWECLQDVFTHEDAEKCTDKSDEDDLERDNGLQNQFSSSQNSSKFSEDIGCSRPTTNISSKVSPFCTHKNSASSKTRSTYCSIAHEVVRFDENSESSLFETGKDSKNFTKLPRDNRCINSESNTSGIPSPNVELQTIATNLMENRFVANAISKKPDDLEQAKSAPVSIRTSDNDACAYYANGTSLFNSNVESHSVTGSNNLALFATQKKIIKPLKNSVCTAEETKTTVDDFIQTKNILPLTINKSDDKAVNSISETSITASNIELNSITSSADSAPSTTEEIKAETSQKSKMCYTMEKKFKNTSLLANDIQTKDENLEQGKKNKRPKTPPCINESDYVSETPIYPFIVERRLIVLYEDSVPFAAEETMLELYSPQSFSRFAESCTASILSPLCTLEDELSSGLSNTSLSGRAVVSRDESWYQSYKSFFSDSDKRIPMRQPNMNSVNVAFDSSTWNSVIKPHFIAHNRNSTPPFTEEAKSTTEKTNFNYSITATSSENCLSLDNEMPINADGLKLSKKKKKRRKKPKPTPNICYSSNAASQTNACVSDIEPPSIIPCKVPGLPDTKETKPQTAEKRNFLSPANEESLKVSLFPDEDMKKKTNASKLGKKNKSKKRKKSKTPSSVGRSDDVTSESLCESSISCFVSESHPIISNKDSMSFATEEIEPGASKQTNIRSAITDTSLKDSPCTIAEILKKPDNVKPGKKKKARKRKGLKVPLNINKSDDVSEIRIFSFDILPPPPPPVMPSEESLYLTKTSIKTNGSTTGTRKKVDDQKEINKKKVKQAATNSSKPASEISSCNSHNKPTPYIPGRVSTSSATEECITKTSTKTKNAFTPIKTSSKNTSLSDAQERKKVNDSKPVSKEKVPLNINKSDNSASKSVSARSICSSNNEPPLHTHVPHRAPRLAVTKASKQKTTKQINNKLTIDRTNMSHGSSTEMQKKVGDMKNGKKKRPKNVTPSVNKSGNIVFKNKIRSSSDKPLPYIRDKALAPSAIKSKPEMCEKIQGKSFAFKTSMKKSLPSSAGKQKSSDNSKPVQKKNTPPSIIKSDNAASKSASVPSIRNFRARSPEFTPHGTSALSATIEAKLATSKQTVKSPTIKCGSFSNKDNQVQSYNSKQDRGIKTSNVPWRPDAPNFVPAISFCNSDTGSMILRRDSAPPVAKENRPDTAKKTSYESTTSSASLNSCTSPATLLAMILKQEKLHVNILYLRAQLQKNFFTDIKDLLTFIDKVDQFTVEDCWVKCKM